MAKEEGLQRTLDEAEWVWLKPHIERDALILVSPQLDLLEVGTKLAADEVKTLEAWISKGLVSKPSAQQIALWDTTPNKRFMSVIVQPYVLIQEALVH